MKNLAGSKEHSEVLQRMRKALTDQAAAHKVQLPYAVPGQ
jgi:hypothetical protein